MTTLEITIVETANRFGHGSTFRAYINGKPTKYKAPTHEEAEEYGKDIARGIAKYGDKFIW